MWETIPAYAWFILLGLIGGLANIGYIWFYEKLPSQKTIIAEVLVGAAAGYAFWLGMATDVVISSIDALLGWALIVVPVGYGADDLGAVLLDIIKKKKD